MAPLLKASLPWVGSRRGGRGEVVVVAPSSCDAGHVELEDPEVKLCRCCSIPARGASPLLPIAASWSRGLCDTGGVKHGGDWREIAGLEGEVGERESREGERKGERWEEREREDRKSVV